MTTAIWVGVTLAIWPATRLLQRRFSDRLERWQPEIGFWARAAHGVLPLYGAWITGAVIGRECGLSGFGPADWLRGVVACGLLIGALALGLRSAAVRHFVERRYGRYLLWSDLFDEPRWAFYRGAGAVPLPSAAAAQLVGLVLGAAEWLLRHGPPRGLPSEAALSDLLRLLISAALFALTRNLWLVMATQAAAQAVLRGARGGEPGPV